MKMMKIEEKKMETCSWNIGNIQYAHASKTDKIFKFYILKW